MSEDNSFGGRVRRYARVGGAVSGVAAKAVGGRVFGIKLDKAEHAREIQMALGGLKGPLMKVAQILSTVPDVLPEEYTKELIKLQTNAPPMGWAFVKRRMTAELGAGWQKRFEKFEHEACKAASLGQVHRAVSLDGRDLACKIQYPDMSSAVEADLKQLKFVFSLYRRYDKSIDPSEIHLELSERLREELDYEREAMNMQLYRHMLAGEDCVHVPEPLPDISTKRLLSMTWLDGEPLLDSREAPLEMRNKLALSMFRAWYVPFYKYGVIHGDPHLGNYSSCNDGSINLLDYGCIRIFPAAFVGAVIDLYFALLNDDEDLAVHAYETWGFRNLDKKVIGILNQWAEFLYAPLLEDKVQTIQEKSGVQYGAGVAAKVHGQLKEVGGVTPPREFVLMDRAAIGLGSVFTHLAAEINWHRTFHELIEGFDVGELAKRQSNALAEAGIPDPV
ncbi:MAG: AarF/ABC1/UbiB kinase family protein [Rhodospirillales bacterium]|nr:AarF/ABC1/UbiB kinase family protein [Rhodospirillales bacterium]MBO6787432.1 AarF/ABC1/UbiB kinase family protein [Rhodospirillales bacterium]